MHRRILGLARDAWWLLLAILAMSAFLGWKLNALLGLTMFIAGMSVAIYFAILRYDDEGREKPM